MQGSASQRCRVHLLPNVLALVARGQVEMVEGIVHTIFTEQHDEWPTSGRRYLTMNHATVLDLKQAHHARAPGRET
jgi:hypothetical protein